jgi:hypothetical protein
MAKTIPFAVMIEETQSVDDVNPILDIKIDVRTDALRFLLFGMNTLKIEDKLLVAQIYNMISGAISREYAWNLGTGVKDLADSVHNKDILLICHEVSHRLYNWVEIHENTPWGKTLSSNWCLPVILKTAGNNLNATKKIVLSILSLIGSENFDIKTIYRLVQDIDPLFDLAPELASKIYTSIFSYEENSKDVVSFGTPVMPLTSNRRQDYQMCFYLLNQKMDNFLKSAPLLAVNTAISCAEAEVRRKHLEKKDTIESVKSKFLDTEITIDLDYSYIWNQGGHHDDKAIELVIKSTNELNRLIEEEDVKLAPYLTCWASNAKVAFSWKQLLEVGCKNPNKLKDHLFSICLTPEILLSSEFEYDIGKYLKAVYSYLSNEQRKKVEDILMSLPDFAKTQDHVVYAERDRDRFLSNIASDLLVTDEAKLHFKSLEDDNKLVPLKKNYSIETRWGKYSDEDYYSDEGIDLKEESNQKLFSAKNKVSSLKKEVLQEKFEIENKEVEIKSLLEEAYKLYEDNLSSKLSSELLTELCSFIDAFAFKLKTQEEPLFSLSKEILLVACKHEKPIFNPEYHSKFDNPGWSPSPRSEGVQGILKLAIRGKDDEIINVIKTLVNDPVPAIRYLVGTELFRLFWCDEASFFEISSSMAKTESNGTVLGGLLNSLRHICPKDNNKIADILQSIPSDNLSDDSRDLFINTVTWYLLDSKQNHQWAVDYFTSLRADLVANHSYLRNLTLSLCNYLEYKSLLENEASFELAKKYLLDLINSSESTLVELLKISSDKKDEIWQKNVHDIYEVIGETITRLYFSFDFKEDNRRFKDVEIPDVQSRYKYYKAIEPLFIRVSNYCENESVGLMFAPTAHYFMQLMNVVVEFSPKNVLQFSQKLVQASTKYNYNLDHMAVNEVVKFVDKLLINHKHEIQDQESIFNLIFLLDTFADVGWPEALKRVWKLDEIFR